jgi:hypothetical protein
MTRLEKCKLAVDKGMKYDPETGKIYGIYGKEINGKHSAGYIFLTLRTKGKMYKLLGHHFGWYCVYGGDVDFTLIDHINQNPIDNRISNLRINTYKGNQQNRTVKGYSQYKHNGKYGARIGIDDKIIHLGLFDTPEKAHQAYLNAKSIYHTENKN